jgi:hypothetical protein
MGDIYIEGSHCGATLSTLIFKYLYYPLLLQRAIEGINKKGTDLGFYIEQLSEQVVVERTSEPYKLFEHMPIDQAKEQALKYIHEQE